MAKMLTLRWGGYALVDDNVYEAIEDEVWTECEGRYIYSQDEGTRLLLHRVCAHAPEGWYVSFLDGNYKNCTSENLFAYDPSVSRSRIVARAKKLEELHQQGVDVSQFTKKYHYAGMLLAPLEQPEAFDQPPHAPRDVMAIRTQQGTLVYVDGADYQPLLREDWRDTGRAILRSADSGPVRMALQILNAFPEEKAGYLDGCHRHLWRDNLFGYYSGHKAAGRNRAKAESRIPIWQLMAADDPL